MYQKQQEKFDQKSFSQGSELVRPQISNASSFAGLQIGIICLQFHSTQI